MRSFSLLALLAISAVSFAQVERGEPLPRKPSFGAQMAPLSAEEAKAAGVSGVKIVRVLLGTSAEAVKLQAGDILIGVDNKPVEGTATVVAAMRGRKTGENVAWKVLRDGKPLDLAGPLREKPRQKEEGVTVVYDQVVSQGKRIRVIATHPEGKGPFPTIFMIGGIGAYSLDGDYAGIPYGNILGKFAKKYAIVRIDKPGQGDSEGPAAYTDLLFDDELDAYRQAMKLTKTYDFVNKDKVAIFGHSMGGAFGPLIAAEDHLVGLAVSGTMGKTWFEYMLENTRRQSLLGGATGGQVDNEMRELAPVFHYLFNEGLSAAEIKEKHPKLAQTVNAVMPDGKTYSGVGLPFFQQLAKKNLIEAYVKANTQVAAIYCVNDFLSGGDDHALIVDSVNKQRPGTAEYIRVPDSDHGFSQTTSPLDSLQNWGRGGRPFNPAIIDILGKWFEKVFGQ